MAPTLLSTETPLRTNPHVNPQTSAIQRLRLRAEGVVQGVGLRPWCAQQATALGLVGWVRNDDGGLDCELQGLPALIERFVERLRLAPPPLAAIRRLATASCPPIASANGFVIRESTGEGRDRGKDRDEAKGQRPLTILPPDTAPCEACLDEVFDPSDRRWRHPFINCTNCGPRYTVSLALPYDRATTTLGHFALCAACASEYADPADRRHHAQAIACPRCGPSIALWSPAGQRLAVDDVIAAAVAVIADGGILAIKGVGGYQLLCDARRPDVVARLRQRKRRPTRPFGLLVPNVESARQWVQVAAPVATLLQAPERPILLLPCRSGVAAAHPLIAPGLADWGLALPASPLHWLLLHEALGRPTDRAWRERARPLLWVMTSANPGGEPLVIDEADALARLADLADALLVHDRPIAARADDSVRRPFVPVASPPESESESEPAAAAAAAAAEPEATPIDAPFVRRARGWVPVPVEFPGVAADAPAVLATGGWLRNTVCVTRGREAFVSPHLGDLSSAASCRALVAMVDRLTTFLGVQPVAIGHDLHPDFFSTGHALALAARWQVPAIAVQHHHAHAAAVMAEHGLDRCLAVVLDGVGLGSDGLAWGGELLRLDGHGWARLSHLPSLPMAGGERVAREPWRLGAAVLAAAGQRETIAARFPTEPHAGGVARLLANAGRLPTTSSAGRLFDAAAALLGLCERNGYEGEAAMRLEACAAASTAASPAAPPAVLPAVLPANAADTADTADAVDGCAGSESDIAIDGRGDPDLSRLYRALADFRPSDLAARAAMADRFHRSLANGLARWVDHHHRRHQRRTGEDLAVVLAGGCWINQRLTETTRQALRRQGRRVHEARAVPCGDGGLSLGQAAVTLGTLGTAALLNTAISSTLPSSAASLVPED